MTDLEAFKAMLVKAGIKWQDGPGYTIIDPRTGQAGDTIIHVAPGGPAVTGYVMFHTEFAFTPEGALRAMGCWE